MKSTIDAAGRFVIPKALREAAGIQPGVPFSVRFRDGRIELEPLSRPLEFVDHDGLLVAAAAEDTPTLTEEVVGDVVATLRLERGR